MINEEKLKMFLAKYVYVSVPDSMASLFHIELENMFEEKNEVKELK